MEQGNHVDEEIFELHAEVCRTLSNPRRLQVISALRDGELAVNQIRARLGRIGKANLSQHLAVMRQKGVVSARRDGTLVYYRISNPKIVRAFDLMREVLFEQMTGKEALLKRFARSARAGGGRKVPAAPRPPARAR
jgi:ArsR family transcriptional regulator, virulence genes transcriptional regulator